MIISIDQSLSCSGIFVWQNGLHKHWALVKTTPKEDAILRIREIIVEITKLIIKHKVTHVVIESLPYGANSPSVRPLAALFYFIQNLCVDLNIVFAEVNVTAVKKFATTSGKAKKEDMIKALEEINPELYNLLLAAGIKKTTGLADLADAYFIGSFYIDKESNEK